MSSEALVSIACILRSQRNLYIRYGNICTFRMPASVHGPRPLACAPRARALHVSVTLRVARAGDPKWMCNLCMLANRLCPECRESALSCACMHLLEEWPIFGLFFCSATMGLPPSFASPRPRPALCTSFFCSRVLVLSWC